MITGYNLKLSPPKQYVKDSTLLTNTEITELLNAIKDYFSQVNVIYDAELVLTNNKYETCHGEYGTYNRRIDKSFKLRYLTEIILLKDTVIFKIVDENIKINIGKNFFWFLEWESNYYD